MSVDEDGCGGAGEGGVGEGGGKIPQRQGTLTVLVV